MSDNNSELEQAKGRMGLYFHWPFCLSKCPYCDFNTHVRGGVDHDAWLAAYLRALDYYAQSTAGRRLTSVFFGGGTPSLMKPDHVGAILEKVHEIWDCADDLEITLEANPTSVEMHKFEGFSEAGVNRLSLGVQALNDKDLAFLGREHSADEARQAFEIAQRCFGRVNFDLIYARPEQSLSAWEAELQEAVTMAAGHLSLYQLTIERGTAFYKDYSDGAFIMPDQELAADFYDLTLDVLEAEGLPMYEISNHARPGEESRHNLTYWRYDDYIGIGPGAHGRLTINGVKYALRDHASPDGWLSHVSKNGHGAHPGKVLSDEDQALESLMMGLRLREGMDIDDKHWRYLDMERVKTLYDQGWLHYSDTHIHLTRDGLIRLNAVLPYILEERSVAVA